MYYFILNEDNAIKEVSSYLKIEKEPGIKRGEIRKQAKSQ